MPASLLVRAAGINLRGGHVSRLTLSLIIIACGVMGRPPGQRADCEVSGMIAYNSADALCAFGRHSISRFRPEVSTQEKPRRSKSRSEGLKLST